MAQMTRISAAPEDKVPPVREHPSRLFVELTTKCNLSCGMCVKQNGDGGIAEGSMSAETFAGLTPAFPHLDALILNGIGESLIHPRLEEFIRQARKLLPAKASVGFQTNGMLLNDSRAVALVNAGLDLICLSLDAASSDRFRSIRTGGEMSVVESAFSSLKKAKTPNAGRNLKVGIEFVVMKSNLRELPAALRWAARQGATFALVTQLLPYQRGMSSQAAYDTNTAGAISIYKRWKDRALSEGVDISGYPDVFMKYSKTPREQKIVWFVEQMKGNAHSQGIALHLERLFSRDEQWFAMVDGIFEEAQQTAEQEGLDLTLPGTAPRNSRRCEFVEEGGAFVSWNGDVHPCYFLWHRYNCYVGGWEKQVKPWVFGNPAGLDILEVWNSTQYRSFRESVRRYHFPFCFDCGFALCDYVQAEDFEQDCYIESVPCGACLWCTGLFHCLR